MPKRVVWQGDAYRPVTIGRRIGRLIPRPIGLVLLRLARRYAPGIYVEAVDRALNDGCLCGEINARHCPVHNNDGPGSEQWERECEEFGCHDDGPEYGSDATGTTPQTPRR